MKTALFDSGGHAATTGEGGSQRSPCVLFAARMLPDQIDRLQALLAFDGATLVGVRTCEQALQEALNRPFALAVVDENLPGCGGLQVCHQLAGSLGAPVPVILRVDAGDEKKRADYLSGGALHLLALTTDVDEIYLHLRNHLRMCRQRSPSLLLPGKPEAVPMRGCLHDSLPHALIITDDRHRVTHVNAVAARLSGLDAGAVPHLSLSEVFAAMHLNIATAWVLQKVISDGLWEGEVHVRPGIREQAFWLNAQRVKGETPSKACHHLFVLYDITPLIQREHRLRWLAETDALTGLANRKLLIARLNEALKNSWQENVTPSLMFIDLDGFKQVNDQLGHGAGDGVLCDVAKILETSVRANDMAARFGGDEFVVLLIGATRRTLVETAKRINKRMRLERIGTGSLRIQVTCSIGIAMAPHDGDDATSLLKLADKAMYAAKRGGKNGYRFASEDTVQA